MPLETLRDMRSLFDSMSSGVSVYLGSDNTVNGILVQVYDDELEVNSRRSGVRIERTDAELVEIGGAVTIFDDYTDPEWEIDYIVRAKEPGMRTTLLILEVA